MKKKLTLLFTLLFAKKFMLITGEVGKDIITTYTDSEVCKSGNAVYFKS